MSNNNESEVKTKVEQANDEPRRAAGPFVCGLSEWIEWRAQKLQGVRREIIGKTRMTGKPGLANRARAV